MEEKSNMRGIIDFHSHILPGIDDGSNSVEESIQMLRKEAEQGITHVVATPHFYPQQDTPERFLAKRAEAEAVLREEMGKQKGLPKLSVGAEVYYFNGIGDSQEMARFTIDQTKYILVEMPWTSWTEKMYRDLEDLHSKQGLLPVIAHVDRYVGRFRTYGIPERLAQMPVLVQANAESFLQRSSSAMSMRLLKNEQIHLLGSDCHDLTSRCPNLPEAIAAIEKRLGKEPIDAICRWQQQVFPDHT